MTWPPEERETEYDKFAEWSALYSGSREKLLEVYQAKVGNFWAKDVIKDRVTMLHVPIAGDIAGVSSDLLFSEKPDIRYDDDSTFEHLDESLNDMDFYSRLLAGSETAAALGGVYLKINYDEDVADYPIINVAQADNAIPRFKWGYLQGVTFHKVISDNSEEAVWRLLEHRTDDGIKYELFKGNTMILGQKQPLTAREETAEYDEYVPLPASGIVYIPNKLPNRLWRGSSLGISDYNGIENLMDALDETYTSLLRDIRLGKARIYVPERYMNNVDGTLKFDVDQEAYEFINADPNSDQKIDFNQFKIRTDEHLKTAVELIEKIVSIAGYSPISFGLNQGNTSAQTATEIKARENKSQKTRSKKAKYWTRGIEKILADWLIIDNFAFNSSNTLGTPAVILADSFTTDPLERANSIKTLNDAQAASTYLKVKMLHDDWTEEEVEKEVERIQKEQGIIVDTPDLRT
jgi:A118 family predicted phage portal protein